MSAIFLWHKLRRHHFKLSYNLSVPSPSDQELSTLPLLDFSVNEVVGLRSSLVPTNCNSSFPQRAGIYNLRNTISFFFIVPSLPIQVRMYYSSESNRPPPTQGLLLRLEAQSSVPTRNTWISVAHGTLHHALTSAVGYFPPFPRSCVTRNDVLLEVCSRGMNTVGWI